MFELREVAVKYGALEALAPTTMTIAGGETLVLLGPSGSGKSTLLRTLAGLTPFTGDLRFEGAAVGDWRKLRQRLGYVIQDGGLFPHLTARGNVTLMARELRWPVERTAGRTAELAALVGLDEAQLDRFPAELSGGQRQRVALMRALMLDPTVLLLDEPLSALDPITRVRLANELRDIFARLGKTVVMVTHSLGEARFFGVDPATSRAVLMRAGRIVQQGSVAELQQAPAEPFVREFVAAETALSKWLLALLAALCLVPAQAAEVGSKKFTESVILGEMARLALERAGLPAEHRRELGGSRILWDALRVGEIDVYPDYTGTLRFEILSDRKLTSDRALAGLLAEQGLAMSRPIGFSNGYALAMRTEDAQRLGIRSIGDLADHPELEIALSSEFVARADGWPALSRAYGLQGLAVRGIDHDLAYRALEAGQIAVTDAYTTDAEIAAYGLQLLADDRGFFPRYDAVFVYRADLPARAAAVLDTLGGSLDEARMRELNRKVALEGISETNAARLALGDRAGEAVDPGSGRWGRILDRTLEHLWLVAVALLGAIGLAIPLGILAARERRVGTFVIAASGLLQTIPSLALFVMLIPLLGIGAAPTIAALFLYSLLPIVRNTHAGLTGVSPALLDSADALGLSRAARLQRIELPLAVPTIMAGVKTAAVIAVGLATLGAIIGAGGYGQPILTGIRLNDTALILEGAIPAAAMALVIEALFHQLQQRVTPRGLRLREAAAPA